MHSLHNFLRKSSLDLGAKLLLGSLALILVKSFPLNQCEFLIKSMSTCEVAKAQVAS